MLGRWALLAPLQWLGFIDLSARQADRPADDAPTAVDESRGVNRDTRLHRNGALPEVQISLGVFVLGPGVK